MTNIQTQVYVLHYIPNNYFHFEDDNTQEYVLQITPSLLKW